MREERLAEGEGRPPEERPREVYRTALNLGAGAEALGRKGELAIVSTFPLYLSVD